MKLIIDIPEKVVTAIQNGEDYRYDIHTTIAQGIPYDEPENVIMTEEEYAKFKDEMQKANRQLYTVTSNTFVEGASIKTEPNGDLISRSEAEKLGATCLAKRNENGQLEAIISLDNAPTVDLWQMRQEATENALKKAEVLYGRTQGEWIRKSNGTTNYYACDKCGSAGDIQDKFCRECGADMRGAE